MPQRCGSLNISTLDAATSDPELFAQTSLMAEFEIPLKMRRIFEKPGFIKGDEAKVAREMYQGRCSIIIDLGHVSRALALEYSLLFNPVQHLSHFGLLCYLGVYEDARKVRSFEFFHFSITPLLCSYTMELLSLI